MDLRGELQLSALMLICAFAESWNPSEVDGVGVSNLFQKVLGMRAIHRARMQAHVVCTARVLVFHVRGAGDHPRAATLSSLSTSRSGL